MSTLQNFSFGQSVDRVFATEAGATKATMALRQGRGLESVSETELTWKQMTELDEQRRALTLASSLSLTCRQAIYQFGS